MGSDDRAFEMSINKKCSVFTGELIGELIEHALYLIADKDIDRDVLLLTDSRCLMEAIINNIMVAHAPKAVLSIREAILKLQERHREGEEDSCKIIIG